MRVEGGERIPIYTGFLIGVTEPIYEAPVTFLLACERITKGLAYMEINHTRKSYSS